MITHEYVCMLIVSISARETFSEWFQDVHLCEMREFLKFGIDC